MHKLGIYLLAVLAGCSPPPIIGAEDQKSAANASSKSEVSYIETESGRYQVDVAPSIDPRLMPKNADLKTVDGDLRQYALKLCGLDFQNKLRPDRCEVFVQPDKTGLLVGYVALQQGQDVRIKTALETDSRRDGLGCFLSGKLENVDYEHPDSKIDISKGFSARMSYSAWEKSPGDWVVSADEDSVYNEGAAGVWYVKGGNNKLRITQERWSYCYSDPNIYLDEVFTRAISLIRTDN